MTDECLKPPNKKDADEGLLRAFSKNPHAPVNDGGVLVEIMSKLQAERVQKELIGVLKK